MQAFTAHRAYTLTGGGAQGHVPCFPLAFKSVNPSRGLCSQILKRTTCRRVILLPARAAPEAEPDTAERPQVPSASPSPNGSSGASTSGTSSGSASSSSRRISLASSLSSYDDDKFSWTEFFNSDLPKKLGGLLALLLLSRVGVYIRLPGVDVDAFAESLTNSGVLSYIDTLSGGSISKVVKA